MTTQPALFAPEVLPQPTPRAPRPVRLVPHPAFLVWYQRTFGVDLTHALLSLRTTRQVVQQQARLQLDRTEGVRPGEPRFVLRVGTFGCVLPWLREE